jgi:ribosomal protein S18 acetylase RimI-like enzyme
MGHFSGRCSISLCISKDKSHIHEVLSRPQIAKYPKDWGQSADLGFIALDANNLSIGAVWCRLLKEEEKGFAHLDEHTPELGIAVLPQYRGKGVGTALLNQILEAAKDQYPAIALSVSSRNRAIRLYERLGFETVDIRESYPVMRRMLNG